MNGLSTTRLAFLVWLTSSGLACSGSIETAPDGGGGAGGSAASGGAEAHGGAVTGGAPAEGGATTGGAGAAGGATGSGGGGGASEVCAAMALVTLGAPQLVEAGGDAVWSPGETATIRVLLTNEGVDNFFYPGVAVTSDVAGVTSSGNTLFGLFQGQAVELDVQAQADAGLAAGTAVNLTLTVSTLNETCQGLDQALFSATLE